MRLVQPQTDKKQITYQSILDSALIGLDEGVQALRKIIASPESEKKEVIAAVSALVQLNIKLTEAHVTAENLPLLQQLEKSVSSR